MKTKLKKHEFLFFLSYIFLYVSLFIGDIYNVNGLDVFARNLRLCSYVLISISCINLKLTKKDLMRLFGIFMITLLYSVKTGDLYWSILILLIYNAKKVDIKDIFKLSIKILVLGIIVVLACCVVGILPDVLTSRNTVELINYNRHSFGFYHSNVLPLLVFYLEAYYVCTVGNRVNNSVIVLFLIFATIINLFCHSRNALILSVLLSVFLFITKKSKKNKPKVLYRITIFSIPCMSFFSIAMMFLLLKGGIWNTIDSIFSGRFRLAIFKMRRIGLHLINIMSNDVFVNDNITYVDGRHLNTIVLDNGYLYITLRYGILMLLFYILVAFILAKKNKNDSYILGTLIAVFVANFIDNDLVDYSFLPFILWGFNELNGKYVVNSIKQRVDKVYKGNG